VGVSEPVAESEEVTQSDLNSFLDEISRAGMLYVHGQEPPCIEVSRKIIAHFNRGDGPMAAIDQVGYFLFHNVKVFERGKREGAEARDARTLEQAKFQGAR
jgi:hypothetical protein